MREKNESLSRTSTVCYSVCWFVCVLTVIKFVFHISAAQLFSVFFVPCWANHMGVLKHANKGEVNIFLFINQKNTETTTANSKKREFHSDQSVHCWCHIFAMSQMYGITNEEENTSMGIYSDESNNVWKRLQFYISPIVMWTKWWKAIDLNSLNPPELSLTFTFTFIVHWSLAMQRKIEISFTEVPLIIQCQPLNQMKMLSVGFCVSTHRFGVKLDPSNSSSSKIRRN